MLQTTTNIAVGVRKGREGSVRNNLQTLLPYLPATFLFLKAEGRAGLLRHDHVHEAQRRVSKDAAPARGTEKKAELWRREQTKRIRIAHADTQ